MKCCRCGVETSKGQPRSLVLLAMFGDGCGPVCGPCRKRAYSVHGKATADSNRLLRHLCGNEADLMDAACDADEYDDDSGPWYQDLPAEQELP